MEPPGAVAPGEPGREPRVSEFQVHGAVERVLGDERRERGAQRRGQPQVRGDRGDRGRGGDQGSRIHPERDQRGEKDEGDDAGGLRGAGDGGAEPARVWCDAVIIAVEGGVADVAHGFHKRCRPPLHLHELAPHGRLPSPALGQSIVDSRVLESST